MRAANQSIDRALFGKLIPINSLSPENLQKLIEQTQAEELPKGKKLFKQGDMDNLSVYLLAGEVTLESTNSSIKRTLVAGEDESLYALANLKPRQYTGISKTAVTFARVDSSLLDTLLTWDQMSGIEVTELDADSGDTQWMAKILQTPAFLTLPAAHIQSLFARLQEIPVNAGQLIIKQGEPGDYYYIVKQGRCRVVRKHSPQDKSAVVAELSEGDSFGEEALLSNAPRNATVAMLSDGSLMRLAKSDFEALLKQPLLNWVTSAEALALVKDGAGLIDVRLESEYQRGSIKQSVNIPLYRLRNECDKLDRKRGYVVYCGTGQRSSAAAFLLGQRGINAHILKGGLSSLIKNAR